MTFTPNIPASGTSLGFTRPLIVGNFSAINTTIAVNHVAMNSAGAGKHKFVQIPSSNIPAATGATEWAIYSNTVSGLLELFLAPPNASAVYQLTASATGFPANAINGTSYLPGGVYVQWGIKNNPGTSGNVDFTTTPSNHAFPNNTLLVIPALQHNSSANESVTIQPTPTATGFSYRTTSSSANTILFWIAIGN